MERISIAAETRSPSGRTNAYVVDSDEFPAVDRRHLLAQGADQYEAVVALFEDGRVADVPDGFVESV